MINIIVLVAGTVDPVCLTSSKNVRANTYCGRNNYWADDPDFINGLKELCEEYDDLALFDKHGWSGDNTKANREIAGAYLADRLCGSNGEESYYKGYRDKNVLFHLIGHSHGGNVLNEFTKRASKADEWPETWKINSVTYLSTPFFKYHHQLDTKNFREDCKIINVINDFDLTQRVIADFSMHDLVSAISLVNEQTPALELEIKDLKGISFKSCIDKVMELFSNIHILILMFHSVSYKLSDEDGEFVYGQTLEILSHTKALLIEVKSIVERLSNSLYYPSDNVVQREEPASSDYFVSAPLKTKINEMLDGLIFDIEEIAYQVNKSNKRKQYSVILMLDDICPSLLRIIKFFTLDIKSGKGAFADLIYELLINQIEVFDNTNRTPKDQLQGNSNSQLVTINLSKKDIYSKYGYLNNFDLFISKLEKGELRYEKDPSQKNLMNILITLISPQTEIKVALSELRKLIKELDKILGKRPLSFKRCLIKLGTLRGKIKPIRKVAIKLQILLKSYEKLFNTYDLDLIKEEDKIVSAVEKPTIGSLGHFAIYSHSVSRDKLYSEVMEEFITQIDCPLKEKVKL